MCFRCALAKPRNARGQDGAGCLPFLPAARGTCAVLRGCLAFGPVLSEQAGSGSWVKCSSLYNAEEEEPLNVRSGVALLHSLQLGCACLILV